ncbi:MAG: molybdopterin-guanine dinucleotide biosynthesis protein MobB, partial [Fimbriimonadaceae bacterium]|nr:molybdopterin-guanine dinucleotide biosynthesis protein MobB [Alphaproteobacteria bacterium]
MSPADLIIIEGYKSEPHLKIEVRRSAAQKNQALADRDDTIVAIAADHDVPHTGLPVFDLDNIEAIADFLIKKTDLGPPRFHGQDHASEAS